jgi:exopolyphosphatase/guanosine-5'-triphosphate,3'-diphosphate pyrophosphatase
MGVEHTQPERGRKLVIDIGGGSTGFQFLHRRQASALEIFFIDGPAGEVGLGETHAALETLAWQFRIQGWTVALGASGTIKAAQEVLVAMGCQARVSSFCTAARRARWKFSLLMVPPGK